MTHATDVRRCLMTCDVTGLMPYLGHDADPADALIALHIARVEAVTMPERLKRYSLAFLEERGIRKVAGRWTVDAPSQAEVLAGAGIASRSSDPRVSERIVNAMGDAFLEAVAGGVDEPAIQKERMLRARARERFRMRIG